MEPCCISKEQVLAELAAIGFAPTGEFFCFENQPDRISKAAMASVAAFERSGSGVKLKFYDKLQALELLGRFLGLEAAPEGSDPGLLQAILESTKEDLDELHSLQPPADGGNDLVEPSPDAAL